MPVVPPPSRYVFDATGAEPGEDLVGVGADLAPGTVLEAYAKGLFPMGLGRDGAPREREGKGAQIPRIGQGAPDLEQASHVAVLVQARDVVEVPRPHAGGGEAFLDGFVGHD